MRERTTLTRRESLASALSVGLGAVVDSAEETQAQQVDSRSRVLVVCFSRSGNTRLVAGHVRRTLNADLFEIQPAQAYPEDYEATVSQAQREQETAFEPALKETVSNMEAYETIFLGFPIWGMTTPPVIRSFLSRHDLAGKNYRPPHNAWRIRHGPEPLRGRKVCAEGSPSRRLHIADGPGKGNPETRHALAWNRQRAEMSRHTMPYSVRQQRAGDCKLYHPARGLVLAAGVLLAGALFPLLHAHDKAPAAPQSGDQRTRAQQLMGDVAPKLAELTDSVLFGDVLERPGLSKRDRSLVTVSALIALNRPDQFRSHLIRARDNGVTQDEVVEAITHWHSIRAGQTP